MYTMASVPQRWCFGVGVVLLVLATCVLECSAQAQPTISGNGLFIVGQTKTMACYISTTEATSNFPLTWSRGGSTLTASDEQTLTVAGNVNYNTFYKLTVAASDNLAVFTCTSTLPSGTTSATWTVYVYKGPDTPIISGPSAVVSGVSNKWTCIVDGASGTSPSVYWQFGNGTRLPQSTFTNVAQVYTDSNQLEIHKETSTLTMTASTSAPSFTLVCKGYHYDTNSEVASELPVTVTYPPEVTGGNVNYTVTAGTTATLVCDVRASPSATAVFWNKDGALIDRTSGRYSGGTVASPSLVISAVVKGDTGYYTCGGTNGIGSTTGDRIYLLVRYAPIITYSQNPVGGVLGSDVTLSCNIDAVPAYTTVLWYRVDSVTGALTSISSTSNPSKYSGGTASTSPALTIKSLAADDAGLYRCKADNDVSRGEGANLQVQVNYSPIMTLSATSYTRNATQSLTIQCSYDAFPAPTIVTWTKNSQTIDVVNSGGKFSGSTLATPSLTINPLTSGDAGVYVCSATNAMGQGFSSDVTVTVNYPPEFANVTTQYTKLKGETVTLACPASASPAPTTVVWYKDNVQLIVTGRYSGGTLSTPALTISSLTGTDHGDYFCRVTNSLGTADSSNMNLDVQYEPEIVSSTSALSGGELTSLTVPCSYDANPVPTQISWRKDGVSIDLTSASYSGGTPGTPGLTITSLGTGDAGSYQCTVVNARGSVTSGSIAVTVTYLPKIDTGSTNEITASETESVTIPCTISAVPAVTSLQWLVNGNVIDTRNTLLYSGGSVAAPSLTILNLQTTQAGVYMCRATNDIGTSDSGNITVYVNHKPKITVQSPVDATEPQSTTLNCIVDALPALTSLTWYKGGQLLDTSSTARYSGGTVSAPSLIIVKVGPADAGSYYCVASNSLGTTTSATITLTVQYFPVFTIAETQVGGTVGGTVTLTVSLAANPAVTSLQWRKHVSSNVYTDLDVTTSKYSGGTVSSPDLQINSLSSSDIGNYVVVATNSLGSGQSVDITVDVSYVPTQPSIAGLQSSYKETELISLTCSASGFPAPAYRWYRGSSLVTSTATLSIASATPSDNSQFTCEAYNTLGNAQATVSVNVQYKPRAGSGLSNVTASIGQDVTLTCTTDANPTPTSYVWYHGGRVVSPASSSSQWTVSVSNSSMLGSYSCIATNSEGASDSITVYVIQQTSGGGDTGGGSVGASTEDTSLSTATLALIIIICLIILIVLILVIVYCCAVKKCFKKDNDVGPTQTTQPPAAIPAQRAAKDSEPKLNGYYSMHVPQPVYTTSNGRISMDEDKTVVPAPAPAPAPAHTSLPYRGSGVSISVPGGGTPRPHHLPPLGQDGVPEEIEPAREEKTKEKKKKRRRRRHDGEDGSPRRNTPRHDPGV